MLRLVGKDRDSNPGPLKSWRRWIEAVDNNRPCLLKLSLILKPSRVDAIHLQFGAKIDDGSSSCSKNFGH